MSALGVSSSGVSLISLPITEMIKFLFLDFLVIIFSSIAPYFFPLPLGERVRVRGEIKKPNQQHLPKGTPPKGDASIRHHLRELG
jgi:hypothetical protein